MTHWRAIHAAFQQQFRENLSTTRQHLMSIVANIAEGNGRFTTPDRRNFFGIARGSVQESVPLLELALRRKLLTPTDHETLKAQLEEIARMLSGLIKDLETVKVKGSTEGTDPTRNSSGR